LLNETSLRQIKEEQLKGQECFRDFKAFIGKVYRNELLTIYDYEINFKFSEMDQLIRAHNSTVGVGNCSGNASGYYCFQSIK